WLHGGRRRTRRSHTGVRRPRQPQTAISRSRASPSGCLRTAATSAIHRPPTSVDRSSVGRGAEDRPGRLHVAPTWESARWAVAPPRALPWSEDDQATRLFAGCEGAEGLVGLI